MATATQLSSTPPHWKLPVNTNAVPAAQLSSAVGVKTTLIHTPPISVKPSLTLIRSQIANKPKPKTPDNRSDNNESKESFLRMRKKLEESRKTFLNQDKEKQPLQITTIENYQETNFKEQEKLSDVVQRLNATNTANNKYSKLEVPRLTNIEEVPKKPTKKISFKIRKNASIYRRKEPKPLNLVQELTKKYNELDEQRQTKSPTTVCNSEKIQKIIKRVNSQHLKRRPSSKDLIQKRLTDYHDDNNANSVKAAIAIFEQKCNTCASSNSATKCSLDNKPKIPEKTFDVQAIAMRNHEKRVKLRQKLNSSTTTTTPSTNNKHKMDEDTMEDQRRNSIVNNLCNGFNNSNNAGNSDENENNSSNHSNNDMCNNISVDGSIDLEDGNIGNKTASISCKAEDDRNACVDKMNSKTDFDGVGDLNEELQVVSLPMTVLKKCESNYECQKFGRYAYAKTIFSTTNKNTIATKIPFEQTQIPDKRNSIIGETPSNQVNDSHITESEAITNTTNNTILKSEKSHEEETLPKSVEIQVTNASQINDSFDDDYEFVLAPNEAKQSNENATNEKPLNSTGDTSEKMYEESVCPPLPPRVSKLSKIYSSIKATLINDKTDKTSASATTDDDYEIPEMPEDNAENIYESLSRCSRTSSMITTIKIGKKDGRVLRNQTEPLPPRPLSSSSSTHSIEYNDESNYYESIYSKRDDNYESIYGGSRLDEHLIGNCKRNSISVQSIQSDQQSNSIYGRSITSWAEEVLDTYIGSGSNSSGGSGGDGSLLNGKAASELSGSSDDWVDISDHENEGLEDGRGKCNKFVIVREARHQKVTKKNSGWSQQMREQWNKVPKKMQQEHGDTDSDHHYETLCNSNGVPILPQQLHHHRPPAIEIEGHEDDDDDFDSFDSDSESDNSFAKNDSGVDMGNTQLPDPPSNQTYAFTRFAASAGKNVMKRLRRNWSMRKNDISKSLSKITKRKSRTDLDALDNETSPTNHDKVIDPEKNKTISRGGFLNKFKRSMSMSGDIGDNFASDRPKSTFYLTEAIDFDDEPTNADIDSNKDEKSPTLKHSTATAAKQKPNLVRPQMPPPPTPTAKSRSQSWYAECGVFKPDQQQAPALPRRPNSFWYAEVGLYQSGSPPSTASTSSENSGNSANSGHSIHTKDENSDDYYNKNYYNDSVKSYDSTDTKKDEAFNSLQGDIQLRLQDEPLYQFYDAAVLESVCQGGSDFYDDYEEIEKDKRSSTGLNRPTAMELVSPQRNNVSVARTLWCEIPEVVQSTVLSTLSIHQKKLQEAKFEMLTSEASYLNSLNVLTDHFVRKLKESDLLNEEEKEILCGKILPVKQCSEKLLLDLEKCWQENILLHGVCDIVKRHAEASFHVYVSYCENQIVLDQTLKRLKEKVTFTDFLRHLESNSICQLLTLYSFVMLPMQRITRWPLLVDAILKRLSPQDDEYLSCQYALATLNKIVSQCNEGARNMERVTEIKKIASQMEFAKGVPAIELVNGQRWLVRSGILTQMHNRGDDVKLTFGKRFTKIPVHLFLFNDIFMVAKNKGDSLYIVQHYCSRSYLEINSESLATLPTKDTQGRHLLFLTILENHDEKTVEMLLSCSSESDKERWLEALTPPKSENPDETLYECWDCPQVTALHNYTANQPDELPLTRGDIINVTRKMADGWYHGERIRDGETGWFPANYTAEVANPHVRARNLKQRYRLLAFSENYLKSK